MAAWRRSAAVVVLLLALAPACGGGDDKDDKDDRRAPPRTDPVAIDAAPPAPALGSLDGKLPMLVGDAMRPVSPPPAALVLIDRIGGLRVVASGGSWAQVTAPDLTYRATVVELREQLPMALAIILDGAGGGDLSAAAQALRSAPPEPGGSVTYAAALDAPLPPGTPLVIADPAAPGYVVAEVVDLVGGAIAVAHDGTVRVLARSFVWAPAGAAVADPSIDVFLGVDHALVAGPAPLEDVAAGASFRPALSVQGDTPAAATAPSIALKVDSEASVQRLIDALVLLDAETERPIGVAVGPWALGIVNGSMTIGIGGGRGRLRHGPMPLTRIEPVIVVGELDQAIIRRYLKRNVQKLGYCYEKQLMADPTLAGVVTARLVIAETGQVASVAAEGVSPEVSSCVAGVMKAIEFPRPRKGRVEVSQRITYKPTGG